MRIGLGSLIFLDFWEGRGEGVRFITRLERLTETVSNASSHESGLRCEKGDGQREAANGLTSRGAL